MMQNVSSAVLSESSPSTFWIDKYTKFLHADNEDCSHCTDVEAKLSLCSMHMSEVNP